MLQATFYAFGGSGLPLDTFYLFLPIATFEQWLMKKECLACYNCLACQAGFCFLGVHFFFFHPIYCAKGKLSYVAH